MLFASDLDSTLVYPARTQPPDQSTEAAEYRDGRVLTCVSTELPAALVGLATAGVDLVPVTARSRSMLDALTPFRAVRIAITAAGGRIWRDGEPLPQWDRDLTRLLGGAATNAQARAALAAGFTDETWIIGEQVIDDLWFVLLAPHGHLPDDAEPRARDLLASLGWTAYGHGRKLYCLPASLRKETAVRWLVARLDAELIAAAGDSEMDVGLLNLAPTAFCPAGSGLATSPLRPAHVRVTSTPCASAGPEILRGVATLAHS